MFINDYESLGNKLWTKIIDARSAADYRDAAGRAGLCQSCEMSYLLHRANLSNQNLPHEKCVNRDKFDN